MIASYRSCAAVWQMNVARKRDGCSKYVTYHFNCLNGDYLHLQIKALPPSLFHDLRLGSVRGSA